MSPASVPFRRLVEIVVCALYVLALLYAALRFSIPSDGARLTLREHPDAPNSVNVSPLVEQPDGLHPDDYIIRVDGQTVAERTLHLFGHEYASLNWQFGQTVTYTVRRGDAILDRSIELGYFPVGALLRDNIAIILFLILLQVETIWIWRQRRDERAPQLLFLAIGSFCAFSICWYVGTDVPTLLNAPWLLLYYRVATFVMLMLMCGALLHFSLILPRIANHKALPGRLIVGIYLTPFLTFPLLMLLLYDPNTTEWMRRWEVSLISFILASFILSLAAIFYGYRQLENSIPRLHVRIIAVAFTTAAILTIIYGGVPILLTGRSSVGWNVLPLLTLPVAFGLGIAVVFYGLFDIRVVIQRTLVWGALTALIISIYILIVGTLSTVFQAQGNTVLSLIATGVVAVMFHSLRTRLQTEVSFLLYGERDAPYQVVKRITQQFETTSPDEALTQFVQTIGTALKLPYSAIELWQDDHYQLAAAWGAPDVERIEFPLRFRSEQIGQLIVSPRGIGETLTAGDRELLRGLAYQAEMMIELARLNVELRASREKLVLAREEERRRLRRDLHDGLGPELASLTLQIDAVRNLLMHDPTQAQELLVELKGQVKNAVVDIRRLVYELRPPALDELGLIGAIREKAQEFEQHETLSIIVDAPERLPPLSAALEVAAYRIVTEAMTNVLRHAGARTCLIRLALNDELVIEVRDDGKGLPDNPCSGVGLRSMSERVSELGGKFHIGRLPDGGTLVCARMPYTPVEQTK